MAIDTQLPNLPDGYDLTTAQTCSFLVNVAVAMGKVFNDTDKLSSPVPTWMPSDTCPVTLASQHDVSQYNFGPIIWSDFKIGDTTYHEAFGFLATNISDKRAYLVFRGSQTKADFALDAQFGKTPYGGDSSKGQVEKGFYKAFEGMADALSSQLKALSGTLTITGHSLGSALATLATPLAADTHGLRVQHYNQASPRVGDSTFADYYNGLADVTTFRLVNTEDTVPKSPPEKTGYVHVGDAVTFSKNYGGEAQTHNPCCSYSYAIYNIENPVNPDFDTCYGSS